MSDCDDILSRMREVNEYLFEQEWSDGLPVIPPTPEGVERMLEGTARARHELISIIPPGWGKATVERIAINGLMAGCKPDYMPVLIAAVQAVTDERYRLKGSQGTTDSRRCHGLRPRREACRGAEWPCGASDPATCGGRTSFGAPPADRRYRAGRSCRQHGLR